MALPYLPTAAAINTGGPVDQVWIQYFLEELGVLTSLNTIVNAIPGVNNFTIATQPALGPANAGYLGWLTDYKHLLRWTGATWEFFGDSGNGFFSDYAIIPQTGLWQLCDGTATKYLTLGALLTETSFTTPNLTGTPAYKKAAAAYTGAINAASGTTGTGTTGTGVTGTGVTGTGTTGTGAVGPTLFPLQAGGTLGVAAAGAVAFATTVNFTIPGLSIPALTVPSLTVPGLSVPALSVGSLDMGNIGVLPYFRR